MNYVRTPEIRLKQSETMKRVSAKVNQDLKVSKWRESLKNSSKKIGRPTLNFIIKICPECEVKFECKKYYDVKHRVFCTRECYRKSKIGIAPVSSEILKNMDRSYQKNENWSSWLKKEDLPEWKKYRQKVNRLSEKTYVKYFGVINPQKHPRTIAGIDGGWQLDHIIPVRECFDKKVSHKQAADVTNLRMLPWKENLARNKNDSV